MRRQRPRLLAQTLDGRLLIGVIVAVVHALPASGQTIRPLVSEYQREARGRVELFNDSDRPLNVVVEPRGFTVDEDGELRDGPLPERIHLKLSAMSFRVPARQSRFVFYEATADRAPAWFVLYANFSGFPVRQASGLNVQLELPHIVYILPREPWKDGDLRIVEMDVRRETGKVMLVVQNDGPSFGRVAAIEVQGVRQKVRVPGFALFPGGRRRLELTWRMDDDPESAFVDARSFSFEQRLTNSPR